MVFHRHRHIAQIFYKTWIYDFDFQTLGFARVAWLFSNWSWWLFSKKSWWLSTWWQIQSGTRRANPRMPARCDALDILLNTKRDTEMKIDRVACLRNNFSKLTFQFGQQFSIFAGISKQGFDRSENAHFPIDYLRQSIHPDPDEQLGSFGRLIDLVLDSS